MAEQTEEERRTSREVIMDMIHELLNDVRTADLTADQEREIEAINVRLCAALGITADDPL